MRPRSPGRGWTGLRLPGQETLRRILQLGYVSGLLPTLIGAAMWQRDAFFYTRLDSAYPPPLACPHRIICTQ